MDKHKKQAVSIFMTATCTSCSHDQDCKVQNRLLKLGDSKHISRNLKTEVFECDKFELWQRPQEITLGPDPFAPGTFRISVTDHLDDKLTRTTGISLTPNTAKKLLNLLKVTFSKTVKT